METLDNIGIRKNKKIAINNSRIKTDKFKAQAEYTEANKQVKKSIKADKQKCLEKLETTEEKAAKKM
ncbi:unnamed protein product [Schistosoma margrebowiei]|uniref:Uncharacterized protein n=1 Tax=Schistosoma margrebowiei TaxID=48269 RepID=A0A183MPP7_9TREM|nr:unnamed protein product [Schistosoma margrebowiei]